MKKVLEFLLGRLYVLSQKLKKNPRINALLYSTRNRRLFGNIDQHERMLADSVRVDTYYKAIQKYVTEGDCVVDVGAGTGVLSFFASQKNPKTVYAIDHGDILDLAQLIGQQNNVTSVEYVKSHSSHFAPEEKVDIIMHEQIGDFLFDEDMVRNLSDLRERVLKDGGKILPARFDFYMEPVALSDGHRTPFLWEQQLYGVDFSVTKDWLFSDKNTIGRVKPYHRLYPGDVSHFLCSPAPLYAFDLMKTNAENLEKRWVKTSKVQKEGQLDGFCLYFTIRFDEQLEITTSPMDKPTHWLSQLFRVEPSWCTKGDVIEWELIMEDPVKVKTWKLEHKVTPANAKVNVVKPDIAQP